MKHHQAAREMEAEVELEQELQPEEPGVVDVPKLFKRLGGFPEPIRVCCIKERRVQTHLKLDMCRHITPVIETDYLVHWLGSGMRS